MKINTHIVSSVLIIEGLLTYLSKTKTITTKTKPGHTTTASIIGALYCFRFSESIKLKK